MNKLFLRIDDKVIFNYTNASVKAFIKTLIDTGDKIFVEEYHGILITIELRDMKTVLKDFFNMDVPK